MRVLKREDVCTQVERRALGDSEVKEVKERDL